MLREWISTERLILRRPEAADVPAIFSRYASSEAVTRYLGWPRHLQQQDSSVFLELSDAAWERWQAGPLLIEDKERGQVIGSTGIDCQTAYRASTGFVLAEEAWKQGFALEALRAVMEALHGSSMWRLEALCHTEHRASARVLEKAEFELEGTLRRHTIFPNLAPEPQDVLIFSRILW